MQSSGILRCYHLRPVGLTSPLNRRGKLRVAIYSEAPGMESKTGLIPTMRKILTHPMPPLDRWGTLSTREEVTCMGSQGTQGP